MNLNDIVICKKSNESNTKDKYYKILGKDDNKIIVSTDENTNPNTNPNGALNYRYYYLHTQIQKYYKYDKFFMSTKELRKIKLEKLNECKL